MKEMGYFHMRHSVTGHLVADNCQVAGSFTDQINRDSTVAEQWLYPGIGWDTFLWLGYWTDAESYVTIQTSHSSAHRQVGRSELRWKVPQG